MLSLLASFFVATRSHSSSSARPVSSSSSIFVTVMRSFPSFACSLAVQIQTILHQTFLVLRNFESISTLNDYVFIRSRQHKKPLRGSPQKMVRFVPRGKFPTNTKEQQNYSMMDPVNGRFSNSTRKLTSCNSSHGSCGREAR